MTPAGLVFESAPRLKEKRQHTQLHGYRIEILGCEPDVGQRIGITPPDIVEGLITRSAGLAEPAITERFHQIRFGGHDRIPNIGLAQKLLVGPLAAQQTGGDAFPVITIQGLERQPV